MRFRDRVRLAPGFGDADHLADVIGTNPTVLGAGDVVVLHEDYGRGRLTSESGIRLLRFGDIVTVGAGYANGGLAGVTYRYLGSGGRADLGSQDYTDGGRWALVSGAGGSLYRYIGAAGAVVDLNSTHYLDGSSWEPVAGEVGSVYEYLGPVDATTGVADLDLRSQDYADLGTWKPVSVTNLFPDGFNVAQSPSAAVGAVVVVNDVESDATATIGSMWVTAGSVEVRAVQSATIRAVVDLTVTSSGGSSFTGEGRSLAAGGIIATNRVLGSAVALVDDSDLSAVGDVVVVAENLSVIEAVNAAAMSSGAEAVSIILAFNTLGLRPTNLFFAVVDAIVGDPLISDAYDSVDPVGSIAGIVDSRVVAGGNVSVTASSDAAILAEVTNSATSAPAAVFGAGGLSLAGVLASNRVHTSVDSSISHIALPGDHDPTETGVALVVGDRVLVGPAAVYEYTGMPRGPPVDLRNAIQNYAANPLWRLVSTVDAGGAVEVSAADRAILVSTTSLYGAVTKTNDAGAGILNNWAGSVLDDYRFTSRSGDQRVDFGDMVRVADDYDGPDAGGDVDDLAGSVVQFMGVAGAPGATVDLGAQDYADFELWKVVEATNLITSQLSYAVLGEASARLGKSLGGSADAYYGVLVYNELHSGATATITDATVTAGGDVVVSADELAGLFSSDDSDLDSGATGGLVVTNVMLASATATIVDSVVTTTVPSGSTAAGDIVATATNSAVLDATAESTIDATSGEGVVFAFNSVGWQPQNLLFNLVETVLGDPLISDEGFDDETPAMATATVANSDLDADGAISVTAFDLVQLIALSANENTASASQSILFGRANQTADYDKETNPAGKKVGGYGKNGVAGGGVVASNKASSAAEATISGGTIVADGDIRVEAFDQSSIDAHSSVVQSASASNTLSGLVDIVNQILVPDSYDYTTASGEQILFAGDRVRLGSTYGGGTGVDGAVYEYLLPISLLPVDLGATDYDTAGVWKRLVDVENESAIDEYFPGLSQFADLSFLDSNARAIGVLIIFNDVRSETTASIADAEVTAGGGVAVRAVLDAEIIADLETNVEASGGSFYGTGDVLAVNVVVAANNVLADTAATIDSSTVTANGVLSDPATGLATEDGVLVEALMTSGLDATVMAATSTGDTGAAFVAAFNAIGWETQNILFNLIDTLLGDTLLSDVAFDGNDVAEALATITDSTVTAATGDVTVRADQATRLNATVSNAATSDAGALFGATGKAFGGIITSNKVSSAATATVVGSTVTAGGDVLVHAVDDTAIYANTKIVISSATANNGGADIINSAIGRRLGIDPDWTSNEGVQTIDFGDHVELADDFGSPDFTAGTDGIQVETVDTGTRVELADRYGESRLTTDSGIRLLILGDVVTVEDGYAHGGDFGRSYRYLGDGARLDLAVQDYRETSRWAPVSGNPGSVYQYLGTAADLDLTSQDYGDTDLWMEIGGEAGTMYEWMGPNGAEVDLGTGAPTGVDTKYTDLGWWKPVTAGDPLPTNWNVTNSDSMGLGGAVVLNDLRTTVTATIGDSTVTGGSVVVLGQRPRGRPGDARLDGIVVGWQLVHRRGRLVGGGRWARDQPHHQPPRR